MKDEEKKILITHLPLSKEREDVFAISKRSRLLINYICQYRKELERKGIRVFERHANIIRTVAGYFCAFYEEDLQANMTSYESKVKDMKPFKGVDGRLKVKLHNSEGEEVLKDFAEMIAMTFIDNPDNYLFVDFKDGNKENCKPENLFWTPEL